MSKIEVNNIEQQCGSTLTLGASSGNCHTLDEKFRVGSDSLTFDQENK